MNTTSIPIIKLILDSDMMGKVIVGLLMFFSLLSWALIFARVVSLKSVVGSCKKFRQRFQHDVRHITEVDRMSTSEVDTPMGQLAKVGADEYHRIIGDVKTHTRVNDWSFFLESQFTMARERIDSALASIVAPFDSGVFLLAMISSVAPFLGLLGTVWGIMNSFYEIGRQGSAGLPVVAPGIASALITTIVGLAVAIPALFFYNYCNHKAERAADDMEEFKDILVVRLRREIFSAFFAESQPAPVAPRSPIGGGY
jgi:biopolymer transport protein TolQ